MTKQPRLHSSATNILQLLELSDNEAILYTLMLDRPRSTVQELLTQAPFPRTMLYYVLKQLIQRGLVTERKTAWRTVYIAEDPERLYTLLSQKERSFERESVAIREVIPQLKQRYQLAGTRPSVRMFEGIEAYQKALDDSVVAKPKEILSYEVLALQKPAREVRDTHEQRRISKKILKKVLFFEDDGANTYLKRHHYNDFTQFRALTKKQVAPFATDVMLYAGKILYTSYYDAQEPTAILIEDAALFAMQKNIFDALWKQGADRTLTHNKNV